MVRNRPQERHHRHRRGGHRYSSEERQSKLIAHYLPKNTISEAYRTLRTNLQFASVDRDIKSLLVTSSGPEEGKTLTVSNLAVVYAQAGQRVLLVDADLRRPSLHHTFHCMNVIGMTHVLMGEMTMPDVVQETMVPDLSLIASGPIPPNPAELLGTKKMQHFLEEAKFTYDKVLIDAPPVLAVSDALVLARLVDGVCLVVRAGQTDRGMAVKAKQQLENVQAPLLGVVYNGKRLKGAANYYYYYYYGNK